TSGPRRENRPTPRLAETAKALWLVYAGLILLCAGAYWAAAMHFFDAVSHSLATISTGGFSTHHSAFGYWDSPLLDLIAIVFMTLGGINFGLHFIAWRQARLSAYLHDSELRAFLLILAGAIALLTLTLLALNHYEGAGTALRHAAFMTVSAMTT